MNRQKPYKWRWNGKEKLSALGPDKYDYGARIYSSNKPGFLSYDPLFKAYPWYSGYQFGGGNPVRFTDLDGKEPAYRDIASGQILPASDHFQHSPPAHAQYYSSGPDVKGTENTVRTIGGFIPGLGQALTAYEVYEGISEGNYGNAFLNAASFIPVGRVGKLGQLGIKNADEVKELGKAAKYTKSTLKEGNLRHRAYKLEEVDPIGRKFKEFRGFKGIRPEFIDFTSKTIYELKPNNPRGIREGLKQLDKYKSIIENKIGGKWNTHLDTY